VTSKEKCRGLARRPGGLSFEDSLEGNCLIFDAWAANTLQSNRFWSRKRARFLEGNDTVYFKRHYNDGSAARSSARQ
jgi:hypothetical protein